MATYITLQDDRLDKICKRYYGTEKGGTVETVLDHNRHLAELGPIYDAGIEIFLPDIPKPEIPTLKVVSLWS